MAPSLALGESQQIASRMQACMRRLRGGIHPLQVDMRTSASDLAWLPLFGRHAANVGCSLAQCAGGLPA